jgi:hypothetical protein
MLAIAHTAKSDVWLNRIELVADFAGWLKLTGFAVWNCSAVCTVCNEKEQSSDCTGTDLEK